MPEPGMLLRSRSSSPTYLIVGGKRRHIPNAATFRYLRFNPDDVVLLGQEEVDLVPLGEALPSFETEERRALRSTPKHASAALPGLPSANRGRRIAIVAAGLTLVVASLAAIMYAPQWIALPDSLTPIEAISARAELRATLVQAFAAVLVVIGMYFTVQTVLLSRVTLAVNTHNQVAERYMDALQLVTPSNPLSTRLGGVLSLARIARSSPYDRDSLARFLTYLLQLEASEGQRHPMERAEMIHSLGDIRESGYGEAFDLSHCTIGPMRGSPLRLGTAVLLGTSVSDVVAHKSDLSGTAAIDARFVDVDLRFSILNSIVFRNTVLERCDVSWSSFAHSIFLLCDMRAVSLVGGVFDATWFIGSDLRGANLRSVDLSACHFSDCDLAGAFYDAHTVWPLGFDTQAAGVQSG